MESVRMGTPKALRVGVDSYTYHRRFGEVRTREVAVEAGWTTRHFVDRCSEMKVDGVSLETCFLDGTSTQHMSELRRMLDDAALDRVLAWGHPGGLEMGRSPQRLADALEAVDHAEAIGAELLRIVVGTTRFFGHENEEAVLERLRRQVTAIADRGAEQGVRVAIETHCDLTVAGLADLIETADRPNLGVVLDTANVVRIGEDAVDAARVLAPHTMMLHLKDLNLATSSGPGDPGGWWPCIPLGTGDVDLTSILNLVQEAGFDGLACVEVADITPGADEDEIVTESVRWLRAIEQRS